MRWISFSRLFLLGGLIIVGGCDSSTSSEPELCADTYQCKNVDLLARLTPEQLLGNQLNDIWGWTDPQTGKEYALVGLTDRVTFVDISVPEKPVVVGSLPEDLIDATSTKTAGSVSHALRHEHEATAFRDIKVYKNHAFVVSDAQPAGLQVFDLTRLREAVDPPVTFTEDAHYTAFRHAHNIAVDKETGYAYVVGSGQAGGGLYILDIRSPESPTLAGAYADSTAGYDSTGYVHDTQCVMYNGPDTDHDGREVCFNSSETAFEIADVTDKQAPQTISKNEYAGSAYVHQGWLTEDQQYFLLDDELDEQRNRTPRTTYIWDVRNLEKPKLIGRYTADSHSIDHNQYIKGHFTYQANYTEGLTILDISHIEAASLRKVAFFDTYPLDDATKFDGAWGVYPFYKSGIVVVSDISNGLFVLSPNL